MLIFDLFDFFVQVFNFLCLTVCQLHKLLYELIFLDLHLQQLGSLGGTLWFRRQVAIVNL